jgi:plastocyanin
VAHAVHPFHRAAVRASLLVVAVAAVVVAAAGVAGAATEEVSITDTGFGPPIVEIAPGDSVTWTNDGTAPHDVTSDTGAWAPSGSLEPGSVGSFSFTFDSAGTYPYRSTLDGAEFTGQVIVVEGGVGDGSSVPLADPTAPGSPQSIPTAPEAPTSTPSAMAFTGPAESVALALFGTIVVLMGWAFLTGSGSPLGRLDPWRILALVDPDRAGFTDEHLPRGLWRAAPRRSTQANLLPMASSRPPSSRPPAAGPRPRARGRRRRGR